MGFMWLNTAARESDSDLPCHHASFARIASPDRPLSWPNGLHTMHVAKLISALTRRGSIIPREPITSPEEPFFRKRFRQRNMIVSRFGRRSKRDYGGTSRRSRHRWLLRCLAMMRWGVRSALLSLRLSARRSATLGTLSIGKFIKAARETGMFILCSASPGWHLMIESNHFLTARSWSTGARSITTNTQLRRRGSDWATCCLEILLRADHASWHSHLM